METHQSTQTVQGTPPLHDELKQWLGGFMEPEQVARVEAMAVSDRRKLAEAFGEVQNIVSAKGVSELNRQARIERTQQFMGGASLNEIAEHTHRPRGQVLQALGQTAKVAMSLPREEMDALLEEPHVERLKIHAAREAEKASKRESPASPPIRGSDMRFSVQFVDGGEQPNGFYKSQDFIKLSPEVRAVLAVGHSFSFTSDKAGQIKYVRTLANKYRPAQAHIDLEAAERLVDELMQQGYIATVGDHVQPTQSARELLVRKTSTTSIE